MRENKTSLRDLEPHLSFVPSEVFQGQRIRAVRNQLWPRPLGETFHDFLVNVVKWTFGEPWWKQQSKMSSSSRHPVIQWAHDHYEFATTHMKDGSRKESSNVYVTQASGPVWAFLTLGYDFFCLQQMNALPEFLVERLRKRSRFQAARYEILAAAVITRAGFNVHYLDDVERSNKHCEMLADERRSGITIGVEAKSRVRGGVLGEKPGVSGKDWYALKGLIRKAKQQKPSGYPFVLFMDVNLPATEDVPNEDKPWVRDMKRVLGSVGKPTKENPSPFNAIFITNYGYHYAVNEAPVPKAESGYIFQSLAIDTLPDTSLIKEINASLKRYPTIPLEV